MEASKGRTRRGTVALEFALVAPVLMLVLAGGYHFVQVISVRHQLTDSVGYAARAMAVARREDAPTATALVVRQMGGTSRFCSNGLAVRTQRVPGAFPPDPRLGPMHGWALEMTASCRITGTLGLADVPVRATATFAY